MSKPLSFEEALALYEKLLETHPEIERKGAEKLPHTSTNTWMFSMVSKDGRVGLRLPEEKRAEFDAKYSTGQFKNYGAKIREYSEVPPELLAKTEELAPWLALSYEYTNTLKPQARKKK